MPIVPEQWRPVFTITTASLDGKPVACTGGLTLTPQQSLEHIRKTDLVIVPGFLFQILQTLPSLEGFLPVASSTA